MNSLASLIDYQPAWVIGKLVTPPNWISLETRALMQKAQQEALEPPAGVSRPKPETAPNTPEADPWSPEWLGVLR